MGLGNFARVHVQAYAADDTVKELADLNADLKVKLDHEHNQRVRERADAKVAITNVTSKAAIDLASMKADMKVAVAEAESRGAARGEAIGFQRAMDETELFDAGFKGGRRQAHDGVAGKQWKSSSIQQWQVETPPASSRGKGPSSKREGTPSTYSSSHQQGSEPLNQPSAHSGRSRHSNSARGKNSDRPISMSAGSRKPSAHDSNTGSTRSRGSRVKHAQYDNGSEASSHRSKAKSFHSRGSGARESKHEAGSKISSVNNFSGGFSRGGLDSQRGTFQGHANNEAVRGR